MFSRSARAPVFYSFPTRRSSDLDRAHQALHLLALDPVLETNADRNSYGFRHKRSCADAIGQCFITLKHCPMASAQDRSEEDTSELQSHHDLVCRRLLEHKKCPRA